jgi:hypothetical protein
MKKLKHIKKPDGLEQAIGLLLIGAIASGKKSGENFGR